MQNNSDATRKINKINDRLLLLGGLIKDIISKTANRLSYIINFITIFINLLNRYYTNY